MKNKDKALVENPQGKRPFGRLMRIWKNNVKMDLKRHRFNREFIRFIQFSGKFL
jgi:hypothetical protein